MSEHPDEGNTLQLRSLLAETGVEESPELLAALLALRAQANTAAPEPSGKLAELLAGTPVPLKSKRRRGIILGTALIGAMAAGATGVAATQDFLVRADPAPVVSFTPEPAPTLERSPATAPDESLAPAEAAPPSPEIIDPAQVPAPAEPAPVVPAPAVPPAAEQAPEPRFEPGWGYPGGGKDHGHPDGPPTGYVPGPDRHNDGGVRDTMGPGGAAARINGGQTGNGRQPENSRSQDDGKGPGNGGPGSNSNGRPGGGR